MNSFNVWFHALETNISEHLSNRLDPDRQTVSQRPRQGNSCGFAIWVPSSWSHWCQLRRETSSFPFWVINVLKNEEVNGKGIWILTASKWGMNKQRESCNCRDDPMYSLEQIHLQVMSHVMQRNIRCSSCCSAGSPRPFVYLPSCISHCSFPGFSGPASVAFTQCLKHIFFFSPQGLCTWHSLCLVQPWSSFQSSLPQGSIPPFHVETKPLACVFRGHILPCTCHSC